MRDRPRGLRRSSSRGSTGRRTRLEPLEPRELFSAGSLDTIFAGTGYVAQYFSAGYDQRAAVAVQPDLKIVAAGSAYTAVGTDYRPEVEVSRYNPDGSRDTSFGSGGTTDVLLGGRYNIVTQAALAPDGKIVVAGQYGPPAGEIYGGFVARFDADGTLDTSFGNGGLVQVNASDFTDVGVAGLAVQPDGKILVADAETGRVDRFNVNGSLDSSFGPGGSAMIPAGTDSPSGLALESNGDIVLYGGSQSGPQVVLYNSSGAMLTSAIVPVAGVNGVASVAVDEEGNIVISGQVGVTSDSGTEDDPFVARLTSDLSLDPTFGQGGIEQVAQPSSFYNVNQSLAIEPGGRYVLTFVALVPSGTSTVDELALARFDFDGSLDSTFGDGGLVLSSIAAGPGGITVQPDGNIVVAANASDGAGIVARFVGNPGAINQSPSFLKGPDQSLPADAGPQSVDNWATAVSPGPGDQGQTLNFIVQTTNPTLFAVPPAITPTGTLTYTPAAGSAGAALVTVALHDSGGTGGGGIDTSPPQTFIINVGSSTPWQNPISADDVNGDGVVTPLDALVIINELNANGGHVLGPLPNPPNGPADYLDVNGDGSVTPLDALNVINYLNAQAAGSVQVAVVAHSIATAGGNKAPAPAAVGAVNTSLAMGVSLTTSARPPGLGSNSPMISAVDGPQVGLTAGSAAAGGAMNLPAVDALITAGNRRKSDRAIRADVSDPASPD